MESNGSSRPMGPQETTALRDLSRRRTEPEAKDWWKMRAPSSIPPRRSEGSLNSKYRVEKLPALSSRYLPVPRTRAEYSNPVRLRSIMSSRSLRHDSLTKSNKLPATSKGYRSISVPVRFDSAEACTRPSTGSTSANTAVFSSASAASTVPTERSPSPSLSDSDYSDYSDDDDNSTECTWAATTPPLPTNPFSEKNGGTDNPFGRCGQCRSKGEQQRCVLPPPPWHWGYERYACETCSNSGGCCDNLPGLWEERR
jgi:hypothetical protein